MRPSRSRWRTSWLRSAAICTRPSIGSIPSAWGRSVPRAPATAPPQLPDGFERDARRIAAPRSDYLQAIDVDRLLALATEHDLVLRIARRPGEFFFAGGELARAWPGNRADDGVAAAIRGAFYFGPRRTLAQDVEFAIDQFVEVAVRALSPAVNNPFTAMNCIDRLGAAPCALAERDIPSRYRYDARGGLRVVTEAATIGEIVDASFNQIRQAARADAAVTLRLLETIAAVARHTRDPGFRAVLGRHADAVHRGSAEGLKDSGDRHAADRRYLEAIENMPPPPAAPTPASPPR